ncbi:MAG: hypothetical protein JEY79_09925 [Pseudodesulfovibrio sp.]|nr:hypothetical protein [Pseudodesulfovibrio sp.]
MNDAVTIIFIILTTALLRWSLLSDPDVNHDVRVDERDDGFTTLVPARVRTDSPHHARTVRIKR